MSYYHNFRKFLRRHHCEEAFDRAFYLHNDFTPLDEALWEAGEAAYFVNCAFDWSQTPEGSGYWRVMDRMWSEELTNLLLTK